MAKNVLSTSEKIIVIGGSAGSLGIILTVLSHLRSNFKHPVVIVLHRKNDSESGLADLLNYKASLPVKEADDKDPILDGTVYIAPADYHLLIETEKHFSLDSSEKINFSRPSIDFTFQTAAEAYGKSTIAILLSGANADGVDGLRSVKEAGGITIVQDPATAQVPFMPKAAIDGLQIDHILTPDEITAFLNRL